MTNRKLSTILLLAFLAISAHAFDGMKCNHDEQDNPEPEAMDIEEDFNPEGNDHSGRTLASYANARFYGYYGLLKSGSSSVNSYIQNDLIPPVVDYFSAALKTKYPVTGLWKTSSSSICGVSTPSILKNGVEADFIYFVTTDSSSSYVANTYTCSYASGSGRPIAGKTTISTAFVKATTDPLLHEKNMICMMHELTHALGFAKSMYSRFINENGQKLSGHVVSGNFNGATATVLNVEPLTTRLRNHFGCSTLKGAYMENSGSSATAGSHFEKAIFSWEFMTSGLQYQQQISQFTLALLEGSGWWVPDYSYADGFWWGQGQGCNFVLGSCSANTFSEFCSSSSRSCTNPGRGGGSCSDETRSDGCKWVHASVSYDCDNDNGDSYARLPGLQSYGRGENAKCFTGTLNTKSAGSQTTFCFKPTCTGSGSATELTLKVGSQTVVCTGKGPKTVTGYGGTIDCPDPLTFCSTVGAPLCPRNCMGRGTCVNGVCQCEPGSKGTDCALNA